MPVLALFLLAPFVGEFLLGNLSLAELPLGLLLAPLYGCGAILVREVGRRAGGWPSIVVLAAAYALIEEGPVDQLLWNESYAGADLLHGPSYLSVLGTSVELIQSVLALHTIWSICVPIALVEALFPTRAERPWLGRLGLVITSVVYLLGAALVFYGNYTEEHFLATPFQLGWATTAIVGLIVVGLRIGQRPRADKLGQPPTPRTVGFASLLVTSAYGATSLFITGAWFEWVSVVLWTVLVVGSIVVVDRWSRRTGWSAPHRFALAAGATLTYAWLAFPAPPESGGSLHADLVGNAAFAGLALAVLLIASRRQHHQPHALGGKRCARETIEPSE